MTLFLINRRICNTSLDIYFDSYNFDLSGDIYFLVWSNLAIDNWYAVNLTFGNFVFRGVKNWLDACQFFFLVNYLQFF